MRKIFLLMNITVFLFASCKKGENESVSEKRIHITQHNEASELLYSDVFENENVNIIYLETNDSVLIKRITKLEYFNNHIYVLDTGTQSVFCFDKTGKFIWKINDLGGAPNEYSQLVDFDIDRHAKKIYLFSRLEKILIYDLNGEFIEQQPFYLNAISASVQNDNIYLYTGNLKYSEGSDLAAFSLLIKNNLTNKMTGKIPLKNDEIQNAIYIFETSNAFYKIKDETRFFMPFSNNIYSVKGDSVYIKYTFDFGKYNIPENYFKDYSVEDLKNSKYMYGLNSYWENDRYCAFGVNYNQKNYRNIIYSKKEDKIYFSFNDDLTKCFPTILFANDDFIVGYRDVSDLIGEYEYMKTQERKNNQKNTLENILSSVSEDSNPVVFYYYFK